MCRVIHLPSPPGSRPQLLAALLLERKALQCVEASQIAKRYNLTTREQQTVELLMEGMRSKEIAIRMEISPIP